MCDVSDRLACRGSLLERRALKKGDGMLLMVLRNDKSPRVQRSTFVKYLQQKYRPPYVRVSQGENLRHRSSF